MESSILSTIGLEIIGVMSPVSICMFLVVLLVYSTTNASSPTVAFRTAANLVYMETPTDTVSQKLEGALLNALVFVIVLAVVTFLLVILYYYNFTGFLKNYMRFSAFFVLSTMGGAILVGVVTQFGIPIDSISFLVGLFNFSVVGAFSVFSEGVPILVRQGYMLGLGIIVAAWFTKLPEWTTWVTLVALAVYDLVAVLAPGGPLKILVELASRRDEELPALVYEARPTAEDRSRSSLGHLIGGISDSASRAIELQALESGSGDRERGDVEQSGGGGGGVNEGGVVRNVEFSDDGETSPLVERRSSSSEASVEISTAVADRLGARGQYGNRESEIVVDEERSPLVELLVTGNDGGQVGRGGSDDSPREMRGGIKLGLGDFIFYSVLVGRAAMYDLMTVYACYLAIISGLGCTLILLSVCRRALPALPISIALGVLFYFLTRLVMEPFIVGTATNLLMF